MKTQFKVVRLTAGNGHQPEGEALATTVLSRAPTTRLLFSGLGGVGGRLVTHLKALDVLDRQASGYVWKDSDRGDRFETTLPGGARIALADSELCRFGVEDARSELQNYPQLARRYRRLLRGIPVALTYGHGAGQWRPIGVLDYELDIGTLQASIARLLDVFYPAPLGKKLTMDGVLAKRQADSQREQPLLAVMLSSAVGGVGSSTFSLDAYYTRYMLERRGATNVTLWGVLVGPRAFQGRGPNIQHNFAATMRELDYVYRAGFQHTFVNGETITSARPPFDRLFQVDLTEWPEGEDPAGKLSDVAMDAFLRQIALGVHLLTSPAMRDRLQSLLVNAHGSAGQHAQKDTPSDAPLSFLSTFNAALAAVDLNALQETLALGRAEIAARRLAEQVSETNDQ
jgi:hypothetical protein